MVQASTSASSSSSTNKFKAVGVSQSNGNGHSNDNVNGHNNNDNDRQPFDDSDIEKILAAEATAVQRDEEVGYLFDSLLKSTLQD